MREPNATRTLQRSQSRASSNFLAAWSRWEKLRRDWVKKERKAGRIGWRRRHAERETAIEDSNRAHLRENLAQVEAGRHWGWLWAFAQNYLSKPNELSNLVDDPETPQRALRNCFQFLDPYIPTIEALGGYEGQNVAEVLLAACVIRFRDGESLDGIDSRILAAAKTEISSYPTFTDGEDEAFEAALDAALFKTPDAAETFIRSYVEQQLAAITEVPSHVHWLNWKSAFQHLRSSLPLEWLERFPEMPFHAARSLFSMSAKCGNRDNLLALIDQRLGDPIGDRGKGTEADNLARE